MYSYEPQQPTFFVQVTFHTPFLVCIWVQYSLYTQSASTDCDTCSCFQWPVCELVFRDTLHIILLIPAKWFKSLWKWSMCSCSTPDNMDGILFVFPGFAGACKAFLSMLTALIKPCSPRWHEQETICFWKIHKGQGRSPICCRANTELQTTIQVHIHTCLESSVDQMTLIAFLWTVGGSLCTWREPIQTWTYLLWGSSAQQYPP